MIGLEKKINYQFNDKNLLETSLTHKSHSSPNNERLEYLGDSIINFYVAEKLFNLKSDLPEGKLTQIRASLVSRSSLNKIAHGIELDRYIRLGKGETTENNSIAGNAFEALIGAIYQDSSKESAYNLLDLFLGKEISRKIREDDTKDSKSTLQEILQKKKLSLPTYTFKDLGPKSGNDRFIVTCKIEGLAIKSKGKGKNIKAAELEAAQAALDIWKDS